MARSAKGPLFVARLGPANRWQLRRQGDDVEKQPTIESCSEPLYRRLVGLASSTHKWDRLQHSDGPCLTDRRYARTLYLMDYRQLITIEPGKRSGKPCIRGLRITVSDVLDYLASGMSEDDVLRDFPDLTREDIRACLAFAADRERRLTATGTM